MSRLSDLVASEVEAAEAAADVVDLDLPSEVKVTRGHDRSKVLQIRLNEDEHRVVTKLAAERGVPTSTFVRALILRTIGH